MILVTEPEQILHFLSSGGTLMRNALQSENLRLFVLIRIYRAVPDIVWFLARSGFFRHRHTRNTVKSVIIC